MSGGVTVGIVGGGAAGALTATHLLRAGRAQRVVLLERGDTVGRGIAYRAGSPSLLLNVPASGMSALPDQPCHFVSWATAAAGRDDPYGFLPRALYGRYLGEVVAQAAGASSTPFHRVQADVTAVIPNGTGAVIGLRDGRHVPVDAVVLALGVFPPAPPRGLTPSFLTNDRYMDDAWAPGALERISPDDEVLLLGTGLTTVDVVLLLAERGHRGPMHAVSRHGLLPQVHNSTPVTPWPITFPAAGPRGRTASDVVRVVRAELRAAERAGHDWRAVVDGLRPLTQHVWRSLPDDQRRRLLARVGRRWEVHRHRMAPPVAAVIERLRATGQLTIDCGGVTGVRPGGGRLVARIGLEPGRVVPVDHVVNCTGPSCDVTRVDHPLVRQLLSSGTAQPGPLGLGFDVDIDGALLDGRGRASACLFTVGALRKGALWETTAVPEIAAQAAALAFVLTPERHRITQRAAV